MSLLKERLELEVEEAELLAQKTLSRYPAWLKWTLLIGLVTVLPLYFSSKAISHAYWQSKYKTDLLAAKPSFESPMDPEVSDTTILNQEDGSQAAVVQVSNKNLDLALSETAYELEFFNNRQELLYTYYGKIFLLPDQKKFLIVPKISSSQTAASAKLKFAEKLHWQKRAKMPKVALIAAPPNIYRQNNPQAFVAEGNFQNNSPYQLGKVHLTFLVYGSGNKIIAASQRDEFTLKPYERRAYKQLWPQLTLANAVSVLTFADTNTLDAQNLVLPKQDNGSASDLNRPEINPF